MYVLGVQEWSATTGLPVRHPLFFTWVRDPIVHAESLQDPGGEGGGGGAGHPTASSLQSAALATELRAQLATVCVLYIVAAGRAHGRHVRDTRWV